MEKTLKVLVCIKQVPDVHAIVSLHNGIPCYNDNTVYVINRYDEYALEEALQLKDSGLTNCIHTVSVGPARVQKTLRRSLEMGAEEAYHIKIENENIHPLEIAVIISRFAQNNYDIIFTGVMSEDAMNQQTGQLIAAMLHYNYATGVTELSPKNSSIHVTRELDAQNSMRYELQLPCVIAVQSSIHKPRYPSLSNVLRARKQEIHLVHHDIQSYPKKLRMFYTNPQKRTECIYLEGEIARKVSELYSILHKNAIV